MGTVSYKGSEPRIYVYVNRSLEHSRTLAPSSSVKSEISLYKITGEDKDGFTYVTPSDFTISDSGTATISDISKSIWNLVLHAYNSENKEILRAYAVADTRNSAVDVDFVLSSLPLIEEGTFTGSLSAKFYYPNTSDFEEVKQVDFYMRDRTTGAKKYYSNVTTANSSFADFTDSTKGYEFTNTFNAGYYCLVMEFCNASGTIIGVYSELVDIQPNRATTTGIITVPDVLKKKPDAPENVYVFAERDSRTADSYNAVITWKDNAVNEESYVIRL